MAGKRYDQHNIAPGEAGSTDYKRYPEASHGQTEDLTTEGDKQRLAESQNAAKGQPFPPDVPAPSVHARHGRRLDEQGNPDARERPEDAPTETGKENPLA